MHMSSGQVRSHLAHDLSCRLPVTDAFKGAHDTGPGGAGGGCGGGGAGGYNICLGDPDNGEMSIAEMNPEEIRAEFKRWV